MRDPEQVGGAGEGRMEKDPNDFLISSFLSKVLLILCPSFESLNDAKGPSSGLFLRFQVIY